MWLFSFEILADLQEIALPEYFYEEYWTIQKRLSRALAAILGGSLGVLLAKKCRPFDFIFRRLDKHLDKRLAKKEEEREKEKTFWKRWD